MSHSCCAPALQEVEGKRKIVLAGNPNVGKSIFFSSWSGIYVDVSNFPGTTVEITRARSAKTRCLTPLVSMAFRHSMTKSGLPATLSCQPT